MRKLLRLHPKTPRTVIYFLAGSIPGNALLHQRQLGLFGMIVRLRNDNVLHQHAKNIFTAATISKGSWFHQIRKWCLMYNLPHPSVILASLPDKISWKKLVKSKVLDYWETILRNEASQLRSLNFFKPEYMNISNVHPMFYFAGHSPINIAKASIQAVMLSGRYRCGSLTRYWDKNNDGICKASGECRVIEDLQHIITHCIALRDTRSKLLVFTRQYCVKLPLMLQKVIEEFCHPSNPEFCSFLLDCSSFQKVICLTQILGKDVLYHLFHISRTWLYALHRQRPKLLGIWRSRSTQPHNYF